MKNIIAEQLRKDIKHLIHQTKEDPLLIPNMLGSYDISYPHMIGYFSSLRVIKEEHLVIGAHFVYGWMPTILHLNLTNKDLILSHLNQAKDGDILNTEELMDLRQCINNSMVGTSKLLHFINPDIYPIWDSRIQRYATSKKSTYGIGKPETYHAYIKAMNTLISSDDYPALQVDIRRVIGEGLKPMREL